MFGALLGCSAYGAVGCSGAEGPVVTPDVGATTVAAAAPTAPRADAVATPSSAASETTARTVPSEVGTSAPPSSSGSVDASPRDAPGTSTTGFTSVEAVAKAIVDAFNSGDEAKMQALFPADSVVDGALPGCKEAARTIADVHEEVGKFLGKLRERKYALRYVGIDPKLDKSIKKGASDGGCTLAVDLEFIKVKLKFEENGTSDSDRVGIARIAGKYYLVET